MEKGLLENTGKTLEQWFTIIEKAKLQKHKEIMELLKSEHGLSHGFANFIALKYNKSDAGSFAEEELIAAQYKGKEALFPIYEKLIEEIGKLGEDITFTPKKDSVSIIRKKQFTLIKPASKTRIDLGLKFKNKETGGRLENSGPFGAMCTHRVQLNTISDVDKEVMAWIAEAYEGAG
jgi:predicted transport protein